MTNSKTGTSEEPFIWLILIQLDLHSNFYILTT
jgi:hypothetical protein